MRITHTTATPGEIIIPRSEHVDLKRDRKVLKSSLIEMFLSSSTSNSIAMSDANGVLGTGRRTWEVR